LCEEINFDLDGFSSMISVLDEFNDSSSSQKTDNLRNAVKALIEGIKTIETRISHLHSQ
jgi:hypothetical protein